MRLKESIGFGLGLLGAILLIIIGITGVQADPSSVNTPGAVLFSIGGLYLFFRIGYRLIKRLRAKNR